MTGSVDAAVRVRTHSPLPLAPAAATAVVVVVLLVILRIEKSRIQVDIRLVVVRTEPVPETVELVVDTAVVAADTVESQKVLVLQQEQEHNTGLVLEERG